MDELQFLSPQVLDYRSALESAANNNLCYLKKFNPSESTGRRWYRK